MTKSRTTPLHFIISISSVIALATLLPAFAAACPSIYSDFSADDATWYVTTTISDSGSTSVAAYAEVAIDGGPTSDLWDTETTYASASVQLSWASGSTGSGVSETTDPGDDGEGFTYVAANVNTAQTTYQYLSGRATSTCNYTKATSCPSQSCGSAAISGPSQQGSCDNYLIFNYVYWYHSGIRTCFPIGVGTGSPTPGGCT